ncbi:dynein light chain Tctex-type 5-B-like [Ptychodera flava]|uniref:dynein light chain Tctex-type 5-B-like n=1 Tax=Ptychodera flava TaxID=63121 RepID=UPI00396A9689
MSSTGKSVEDGKLAVVPERRLRKFSRVEPPTIITGGEETDRKSVVSERRQRNTSRSDQPSLAGLSNQDRRQRHSLTRYNPASSLDVDMHSETSMYLQTGQRRIECEPTYRMEPKKKFRAEEVEDVACSVLKSYLKDTEYDADTSRRLSQQLAGMIMDRVKSLGFKRYKFVTVVSIGSIRERPGMNFGSRCLWDPQWDTFTTVQYKNASLFAIAMIYGVYFE